MSNENIVFAPVSKPQEVFLNSQDTFFTLYGGAAGAGKSAALLGSILGICHHPGTRVLILRKTTKQLSGAGSLFDAAIQLFGKVDPKLKIKMRDLTLVFSSGAVVQFSYLDKPSDRMNFQGKEYSRILLDEAQQLDEENVLYVLSRLRSTIVDYPLQVMATCNPDYNCFLRSWVEFTLDEKGIPVHRPKHDHPVRYFVRTGTTVNWFDTLEEAQARFGKGKDSGIKSFKFIPATALDNPVLMRTNPDYISTLKNLPSVERDRLLYGSWYARESAAGYFKREWVNMVNYPNLQAKRRVRAWDLAFSEASEVRPDVDATAGVLMSKDDRSVYTVENVITLRKRVHEVERMIFQTAIADGKSVIISLPLDPGATAGAYCRDLSRRLAELGFSVKLTRPDKGKLQRFLPFASVAEAKFVNIVEAEWTAEFFTEMENMDFTNKTHDDIADACSDAFYHLNRDTQLPTFSIPDMTKGAAFGFQQQQLPTASTSVDLVLK